MTEFNKTTLLSLSYSSEQILRSIFRRAERGIARKAVLRNPVERWINGKCFIFTEQELDRVLHVIDEESGPIDHILRQEISEKVMMSTRLSKMRNRRLVMEANPVKSRKR